jgi:hypothetical protein
VDRTVNGFKFRIPKPSKDFRGVCTGPCGCLRFIQDAARPNGECVCGCPSFVVHVTSRMEARQILQNRTNAQHWMSAKTYCQEWQTDRGSFELLSYIFAVCSLETILRRSFDRLFSTSRWETTTGKLARAFACLLHSALAHLSKTEAERRARRHRRRDQKRRKT